MMSVAHSFHPPEECAGFKEVHSEAILGWVYTGNKYSLHYVAPPDFSNDVSIWKLGERSESYEPLSVCNDTEIRTGRPLFGFGFPQGNNDYSVQPVTWGA